MADSNRNIVTRTLARIQRFLGVTSSSEISDYGKNSPADIVSGGSFSKNELRNMIGIGPKITGKTDARRPVPKEADIQQYLEQVSDNTHTKIEEIKNLVIVAPEIKVAKRVIVSSILSPQDMQTNQVNIMMDYDGISQDAKNNIIDLLNKHFNQEFHLGTRLAEWLTTAGFEEGAKAIVVLPKHELDVQNVIADTFASNESLKIAYSNVAHSEEALTINDPDNGRLRGVSAVKARLFNEHLNEIMDAEIDRGLESLDPEVWLYGENISPSEEASSIEPKIKSKKAEVHKMLREGTVKLIRGEEGDKDAPLTVTRNLGILQKSSKTYSDKLSSLLKDAQAQLTGFDPKNKDGLMLQNVRCYSISDSIKLGDDDLPIVLEIPSDAVIPVCAPRDKKSHIGYFVLFDENGQPISGKNNYFATGSTDVTNRLAMSAAKGIYGNATMTSFSDMMNNPQYALDQMTNVFAVAVNKLLESKLSDEGLTGLQINIHNAVGKALFLNLLSRNKIKMVFVPEPMMVYYRFDHREDGTGKSLLEDVSQILAMRTTLTVAKLMAAVDSATLRRRIEVNVDTKDNNPIQTMQMVVRQALSKYAPSFSTEVQTAAESIVNRNLQVVPKAIAGTDEDLSVSYEKNYGQGGTPGGDDLLEKLNNWFTMHFSLPPAVVNQVGEQEFSRSVATTNMFFGNTVAAWQIAIRPMNQKFVMNYVSANAKLIQKIREIVGADKQGEPKDLKENKSSENKDAQIEDLIKNIISSLDVALPTPTMAVKKAHFEEIQSFADAIDKIVAIIYSDEVCVDDNLKGNMSAIRAAITSKILREFLPKLGCQAIADIPEPSAIDADYTTKVQLYLANVKRRIKNLSDLTNGTLPLTSTSEPPAGGSDTGTGEGESGGAGSQEGEPDDNGGAPDMSF